MQQGFFYSTVVPKKPTNVHLIVLIVPFSGIFTWFMTLELRFLHLQCRFKAEIFLFFPIDYKSLLENVSAYVTVIWSWKPFWIIAEDEEAKTDQLLLWKLAPVCCKFNIFHTNSYHRAISPNWDHHLFNYCFYCRVTCCFRIAFLNVLK